ncbi:TAP binding protein (tapasin), tandem duplicate 1 [Eucyclogobius newberryi]|uniref:TAP binding protein (tapasin), tandem duplicate 1 n=1 Tax=Eucyclogobius newberryi TaxID=166745 RepID=UPI003B59CA0A
MTHFSTIYKLSLVAVLSLVQVCHSSCPVMECWYMPVKAQVNSLLFIKTDEQQHEPRAANAPSDVDHVFFITDPSASLCHRALNPPEGSIKKPHCELNQIQPQPSSLLWVAPLTDSAQSPLYLEAQWFAATIHGLDKEMSVTTVIRAPEAGDRHNVILSVTTKTVSVMARLGEPALLDCSFWVDPSSPFHGAGFSVEWRYQFRGNGRMVLGYDGKTDRLSNIGDKSATLDFESLHRNGNASLILTETKVKQSGTYICSVHMPYLLAQVALELEVVEPPSVSIFPSPLPLIVSGQSLALHCEATGFAPLPLDFSWVLTDSEGNVRPLGSGSVSGHREGNDATFSQTSRLKLDSAALEQGKGGELSCVAATLGGTRRTSVALNVIGFSTPSIEDSMAMVGVALVLYGLIKFVSWTFSGSGDDDTDEKKKN